MKTRTVPRRYAPGNLLVLFCSSVAVWLTLCSTSFCGADYLSNPYNREIVFSGYDGSETLTDFPLLLIFNTGITDFDYTEFKSDGGDLRFADADGSELAYEIEEWNTSDDSYIWVNVSEMASNTNLIKMYWGNPALNQPSYTTNGSAWSDDYAAVWHMEETDPDDSTANGNDGTGDGNTNATGLIVGAQDLDGTDDYIDISAVAAALSSGSAFTISGWLKTDDSGGSFGRGFAGMYVADKTSQKAWIHVGTENSADKGELAVTEGETVEIDTDVVVSNLTWHHICYTRTDGTGDIYVDGNSEGSHNSAFTLLANDVWVLGCQWKTPLWPPPVLQGFLDGTFDEVRVSNTERSADWIEACYDSQKPGASFVTYGEIQITPSVGSVIFGW